MMPHGAITIDILTLSDLNCYSTIYVLQGTNVPPILPIFPLQPFVHGRKLYSEGEPSCRNHFNSISIYQLYDLDRRADDYGYIGCTH